MQPSAEFSASHVLGDGTRVTLRMARPEDRDELKRGFERLSPESRYRRFFTVQKELSDEALRYLSEVDGFDHVAIVALRESHDLKSEEGLGVARFIRLKKEDKNVAEAAVTVIDDLQNRGLGKLLLKALANAARERDVRVFRGEVLKSNAPMRKLMDEAGATVRSEDGETIVFDVPIDPPGDTPPDHPLRRLLRAVAESIALGRRSE